MLFDCDLNRCITVRLLKFINSEFTNLLISCAPNMSRPKNIREPSSHPSPTQESTKLQGSFVNLSVYERQKQNFSQEEYVMINDCIKDKPSFVKWSTRFLCEKRALKTVDLCFSRKHLCVYSDTHEFLK